MSSPFSYELDERQVRILMQDTESEYNESLWNKFETLATVESKTAIDISNYVPKFNLSISRSVVVPVMFIILIGGLSAMLFSFVDFKKKEAINKEIPLVANPQNFKKVEEVATTNITKPVEVKAVSLSVDTTSKTTPTIAKTETPSIINPIAQTKKEGQIKIIEPKPKAEEITAKVEVKKDNSDQPTKKKKKRKIATEELPSISTVTNLNEGISEPELDLK